MDRISKLLKILKNLGNKHLDLRMKKLFFIFIFLSTTFFTNQVAKPMETHLRQVQPTSIGSRFRYSLIKEGAKAQTYFIKYKINSDDNKFSPLTIAAQQDETTLMLIFKPNGDSTDVICSLENGTGEIVRTISYLTTLKNCSFYEKKFKNFKIKLIETSIGAYFRQFIPSFKACLFCKEEIKNNEAAILLKYGHAIHTACYQDKTKEIPGLIISENDFWTQIEALPQ